MIVQTVNHNQDLALMAARTIKAAQRMHMGHRLIEGHESNQLAADSASSTQVRRRVSGWDWWNGRL